MKNELKQPLGDLVENWSPKEFPTPCEMRGRYCVVKPLDIEKEAALLFKALQGGGEALWTYFLYGPFADEALFIEWLQKASVGNIIFSIIDLKTNLIQGMARFDNIDPVHGTIEIGTVMYAPAIQKTRIGTEAMYLMLKEVFEHFQYRRCQWRCHSLNKKSRAAAERLGFKYEGTFRQHYVARGRNRDTAWYSIIDSEWPLIKRRLEGWLDPENFDDEGQQKVKLG